MLLPVNYNEPFSNYLSFICGMLSISPRVCNSRVTSIILVALTHTRGHSHMVYESTICFHFIFLLIFIFILFFIYIYTFVRKARTKMHHNMLDRPKNKHIIQQFETSDGISSCGALYFLKGPQRGLLSGQEFLHIQKCCWGQLPHNKPKAFVNHMVI